jgi:hypothetical protein
MTDSLYVSLAWCRTPAGAQDRIFVSEGRRLNCIEASCNEKKVLPTVEKVKAVFYPMRPY